MNRIMVILLVAIGFVFTAGLAAAEDFSHYSNERLSAMRHSMHDATPERQIAYKQEIRRRYGVSIDIGVNSEGTNHYHGYWYGVENHHEGDRYHSSHHDGYQEQSRYNYRNRRGGGGGMLNGLRLRNSACNRRFKFMVVRL